MASSPKKIEANQDGWPIYDLWAKYEDIAMHFNDLLIKLRTQALAAVAALTTIIGIFAKSGADTQANWQMVGFAFAILIVFWIAVGILDFCYYNPLLLGAAEALFRIEEESKTKLHIRHIEMSTKIRDAVAGQLPTGASSWNLIRGRWLFYVLVLFALSGGLMFSIVHATA